MNEQDLKPLTDDGCSVNYCGPHHLFEQMDHFQGLLKSGEHFSVIYGNFLIYDHKFYEVWLENSTEDVERFDKFSDVMKLLVSINNKESGSE